MPLRLLLGAYADAPLRDRVHLWLRWRSCPFDAIEFAVPMRGAILEVGCGHGLLSTYLALGSFEREVTGEDVDDHKIGIARRVQSRVAALGGRVQFDEGAAERLPAGPWDAVVVVDVIYLLTPAHQRQLIADAAAQLAPRGVLVVKETALRPTWKYRLTALQEWVALRVLHLTSGEGRAFAPPSDIVSWMKAAELDVKEQSLAKGHLHPHHLIVGRCRDG